MRILIVDDSEDIRDLTQALLVDAGYRDVATADSAATAFELLKLATPAAIEPTAPNLLLLDIIMPDIDGIEACARIKNDPRYMDLPIIMVTQRSDMDTLANAFVAGATDYITKPVERVELLARVRTALKLKSELDRRKTREEEMVNRLSKVGEGRAWHLIDDVTGLLAGEVAETCLTSSARIGDDNTSVIALMVDRIEAFRSAQGQAAVERILAQVARSAQATVATAGVVLAAYRDGLIVLIMPHSGVKQAVQLADALRTSISNLAIANPEAIVADHITASVAVANGRVDRWNEPTRLLTRAISVVREVTAVGGDRVATVAI